MKWRYVHNGTEVLCNPFETDSSSITVTKFTLREFDTKAECEADIATLELTYTQDEG